jgi:hypothetical protein
VPLCGECSPHFLGASDEFVELGRLSSELGANAGKHLSVLANSGEEVTAGSCNFNLILINKCLPESKIICCIERLFRICHVALLFIRGEPAI